ncbi:MAG: putative manganese transporter [Bacteroidota bacterium]|nr:putative manganese transporter [Bacteroidota bacterium]
MLETLYDVLRNTLMITSFVIVIMLFIELLNVFTQGKWSHWLSHYKPLQVVVAATLGLIPGCFGGFAAVSMWTHGALSFGALLAALISGVGDEAFVMMVQMPGKALFLFAILFVIAVIFGFLVDLLGVKVHIPSQMKQHLVLHEHEEINFKHCCQNWKHNFKPISFTRVLLITSLILFILAMSMGFFEHEHETSEVHHQTIGMIYSHDLQQATTVSPTAEKPALEPIMMPFDESWFNSIFIGLAILVLMTFFMVDDHFLEEHLWKHIIKQHVPKIALWTFAALLLIHTLFHSVDLQTWVQNNTVWMLLIAVLIGFIPESGPHLVFISLFLTGSIPFSILLANSITQDGHASLPLLAESKRGFITAKLINGGIGLLAGLVGYLIGF